MGLVANTGATRLPARRLPADYPLITRRLPADCLPIACLPGPLPAQPASGGIPSLYSPLKHEHETVS